MNEFLDVLATYDRDDNLTGVVEIHKKVKTLFVSYHILWCIMITFVALIDGTAWNAWLSVFVMFGFTFWGAISNKNDF